jgi:hypothetical protein
LIAHPDAEFHVQVAVCLSLYDLELQNKKKKKQSVGIVVPLEIVTSVPSL